MFDLINRPAEESLIT
jgi:hypothetical protein